MSEYILAVKAGVLDIWGHDPSVSLFKNGELIFAAEEERFSRDKHANGQKPSNAIREALDYAEITFSEIDKIVIPFDPSTAHKVVPDLLKGKARAQGGFLQKGYWMGRTAVQSAKMKFFLRDILNREFAEFGDVPPITFRQHHRCHAASAFYPTDFDSAVTVTLDGRGEYDSTVIWQGTPEGLERVRTYDYPNSLGAFFGIITKYLGFRPHNGEGKVMGLAPYGERNEEIESALRSVIETGVDYDVTELFVDVWEESVQKLEQILGHDRHQTGKEFTQFEKDLAYTAQRLLEETVVEIVEHYAEELDETNVALAGGVALNCKMNKRVMESEAVDSLFVQPVANDGGLPLGAGMLENTPSDTPPMRDAYWGVEYGEAEIEKLLKLNKIQYHQPDDISSYIANKLANGKLIGWFQGRFEIGPRALGNRSILADPRTAESRERVNKYVKHREEWRPFAPSILAEAADEYLVNAEESPFMIKTFDIKQEKKKELEAVLHPGDDTTRPQTVTFDQNPRYYNLIDEFEERTGVPVVLNTSFNDHAEPIVNQPVEALKDFYGMGLDLLVLGDFVVEKSK
ncbi:carbamoyltransferase family protein [Haloparvum sp. PAK95]|uniref:carbamoyltransferase family protein n=1 Tax=Haloparvum sp. PAK95 TaxID=3418962 RepID=UPI003D2F4FB7